MIPKHVCSLLYGSESYLPVVRTRNFVNQLCRSLRKLTIASSFNKRCSAYFRSQSAIVTERKRHIESHIYIIHPFSIFRFYWEFTMVIVLLFALILNPLDVAFNISYCWTFSTKVIFLINIICVIDIIINFFTGYGKKVTKEVVLDPLKIARHQFRSIYFYLEVICCLPNVLLYAMLNNSGRRYVSILSILKFFRFHSFIIYLRRTAEIWNSSPLAYLALEYSTAGIIILHWTACIHYALPVISGKLYGVSIDKYWIGKEHILEYSHPEQYIRSVFRAATLLFNIGHGGYVPTTALEIILNIVTVLIGYVYNAFLLVLVLQIMASNLSAELKYQEIINQVEQYMTCKRLPISMQKRLLQYYEYRFQKKYFRDNAISTSLSDRLRKEINLHSFRRLIESVSIFKDMPRNLILDIVSSLKEEIYLPNDIIVKAHSIGDCMYFLASGTVCVTTATGKEVCHLYDGAYFGEVALLMKDQMRVATVYALEICKIYRLDRTTFENCFVNNIELYKNILNIAQDRKERTAMLEEIHKTYITSLEESRM